MQKTLRHIRQILQKLVKFSLPIFLLSFCKLFFPSFRPLSILLNFKCFSLSFRALDFGRFLAYTRKAESPGLPANIRQRKRIHYALGMARTITLWQNTLGESLRFRLVGRNDVMEMTRQSMPSWQSMRGHWSTLLFFCREIV